MSPIRTPDRAAIVLARGLLLVLGLAASGGATAQVSPAEFDRVDAELREADRLQGSGQVERAIQLLEAAHARVRPKVSADDPTIAALFNGLGNVYAQAGRLKEAEEKFRGALKIARARPGETGTLRLSSLHNLVEILIQNGQYDEAARLNEESLRETEKALGPDDERTQNVREAHAKILIKAKRPADAIPIARDVLNAAEKRHGADHVETIPPRNTLANALLETARYPEAEKLLKQALAIAEKHLPAGHDSTRRTKENLAAVYQLTGRAREAAELLGPAGSDVRPGPATATNPQEFVTRALAAQYAARFAEAETYFQQALALSEARTGKEHPEYASILANLSGLRCFQLRFQEGEQLIRQALAITAKQPGVDSVPHAKNETTLGFLLYQARRHAEAEGLLVHAEKVMLDRLGPGHPDADGVTDNLAMVLAAQGRWGPTIDALDRARKARVAYVSRTLPALPEDAQLAFLATTERASREAALAIALARRTYARVASRSAEWLLNSKGITHRALAQRALLARDAYNPGAKDLLAELNDVRGRLANRTLVSTGTSPGASQASAEFQSLQKRETELATKLGQAIQVPLAAEWSRVDDVRARLPEDAVFIDFARVQTLEPGGGEGALARLAVRYAAWVVPPAKRGAVSLIDLGPAAAIERKLDEALGAIQSRKKATSLTDAEPGRPANERLRELAELLHGPLRDHLDPAKRWVLAPDAALWLVPWAALPITADRFAVEDHVIHLIASGRELLEAPPSTRATPPVILADPDYDLAPGKALGRARQLGKAPRGGSGGERAGASPAPAKPPGAFERLDYAAAEARAIAPLVATYARAQPEVYLGEAASESVVKSARGPRALVLSTHAFFLPEPAPVPAGRFTLPGLTVGQAGPAPNPLLRGGLALAGYNRSTAGSAADHDDGLLSALEVVGCDLRGTDLVVLSACETALGEVQSGEGVAGLRQAFQLAGARTVVASLWEVRDAETFQLVAALFQGLARGRGPAAALREAQLAMIEDRRHRLGEAHPYAWAAFSATGFPGASWREETVGDARSTRLPTLPDLATALATADIAVSPLTGRPAPATVWPDLLLVASLLPVVGLGARWWWRSEV